MLLGLYTVLQGTRTFVLGLTKLLSGLAKMSEDAIHTISDYERLAKKKVPTNVWSYFAAYSGKGVTFRESENAYRRLLFRPRLLKTNFERDLSVEVFGQRIRAPVGVSPSGFHGLVHTDAEKGTARGVEKFGTIMIVSNFASTRIEDIASAAPAAQLWMQTYIFKNRQNTVNIIRRAERLGFKAIVITIDLAVTNPWKSQSFEKMSGEFGSVMSIVNMDTGDTEEVRAAKASGDHLLLKYMFNQTASCAKWEDVAWVKTITALPVLVKGVLTAETAREAASVGVDGIIVSAHGGRQLDEVPAPLDALPEIIDAVRGKVVDVLLDGGIRSGADIVKALGLGAKMVFIGRPSLWGLAVEGSDGVCGVLEILEKEMDYTMALCGCNKIRDIDRSLLQYKTQTPHKL